MPKRGGFVGPGYHLRIKNKQLALTVENARSPFYLDCFMSREDITDIKVYREVDSGLIASFEWNSTKAHFLIAKILDPKYRGSGLASVFMNIFLRSLYERNANTGQIQTTRTLEYANSNLRVIGWLGKFGIDCYKSEEMDHLSEYLWENNHNLIVKRVEGDGEGEYYFQFCCSYSDVSTNKVFLLSGGDDYAVHQQLLENRQDLREMVEAHEAYLSLPMHIDPDKAGAVRRYAAGLPDNQAINVVAERLDK